MKEMREARELLLKEIEGLSDEDINKKISEEQWSIVQIVEHVCLLEQKIMRGIKVTVEQGISEQATNFPLERIVDRSVKIKAPNDMMPGDAYKTVGEVKNELNLIREQFVKVVNHLTEDQLNRLTMTHRRFGILNLQSWISLIGFHEQRHILQIKEVKESLKIN
ncbi:MAG: DinB family protein [Bacillaceae bacterium]